jgi:hypothetical protein
MKDSLETKIQRQMHDPTLPIIEAIHSNEPKWAPGTLPGLEVRWEVLRCETTVRSVCIWLDLFAYFFYQEKK